MKNIHVLATSKDSRLFYSDNSKELKLLLYPISFKTFERSPQHLYITNDEEIKEGDWCIIIDIESSLYGQFEKHKEKHFRNDQWRKIILTTSEDLIKDGVQAIDDEFLEWFVKNPSCERVEVEKYHGINTSIAEINTVSGDGSLNWEGKSDLRDYKIIVPQEEPIFSELCSEKKETLQEAAERLTYQDTLDWENILSMEAFKLGAKWQAERMYSEEEVIAIVEKSRETGLTAEYLLLTEQFKNNKK